MSAKHSGRQWCVTEQIVRDLPTGLTLQFGVRPDGSPYLRIYGESLPFGNREIGFAQGGEQIDGGTATASCPTPTWIRGAG